MIKKIAFALIAGSLVSTSAIAGVHKHRNDAPPPPPPPRGELHERICDGATCCNFDVDGRTLNYTLRCDRPIREAELTVGNRRPEVLRLFDHGRLSREIAPGERMSVKLTLQPSREIHTRLCDKGNCCQFDVNGRNRDYTLRCDRPFERAELFVNGPQVRLDLRERGRLTRDVFENDHISLKLTEPPSREIHKRLCDRDNCCNLDVNGRSRDYTLRCDRPFERAELTVNGRMTFDINDRGHMTRDVFENDRLDLRLSYPPPPPPPSEGHKGARAKAREDARHRR